MPSQQDTRRSTSTLLYDENEKTLDAMSEQKPLLGYVDISDSGTSEPCHRRVYARYSLLKSICVFKNFFFSNCFSRSFMDFLWFSLFIYVTC